MSYRQARPPEIADQVTAACPVTSECSGQTQDPECYLARGLFQLIAQPAPGPDPAAAPPPATR